MEYSPAVDVATFMSSVSDSPTPHPVFQRTHHPTALLREGVVDVYMQVVTISEALSTIVFLGFILACFVCPTWFYKNEMFRRIPAEDASEVEGFELSSGVGTKLSPEPGNNLGKYVHRSKLGERNIPAIMEEEEDGWDEENSTYVV